ncbi:GntR family transcriptional regulator [Corallococcus exercitus]|uniref:GntR family transcriptional regulator n=1 Tax=Corallococcus exercitus TaxID=2316736 RepID=A0A7Y4NHV4_9BACT|nr:GntR family transcriptional regulator [Corallococcus exercitus]NOK13480.1 GntR family transcriptional regulator [Corallococcus exercitus]
MVRVGLVAYVEEQLEQDIALGRLPRSGVLASERMMARRYGVSRGTVREALRRLAARGLLVQHPGRQARAVALDESLTLENLGLALHDERSQECRWLLEGFFSLKRQVLVELLSDCCANASVMGLGPLEETLFQLWDAARWHPGERCAQLEFELLRLAAQAAARPGHLLLIQSLQRAFRGIAARLLPFMGGESLREWAICAKDALQERDMQALQHQLPALLKACDERMLDQFTPAPQRHASPEAPHVQECGRSAPASAPASEAPHCLDTGGSDIPTSALTGQDDAMETSPCVDAHELGASGPAAEATDDTAALTGERRSHAEVLPLGRDSGTPLSSAAPGPAPCEHDEKCIRVDMTDAAPGNPSEPPSTDSEGHTLVVLKEGDPPHAPSTTGATDCAPSSPPSGDPLLH